MGHLTASEPWGTVDLDTTEGRVWVQQKWFYTWTVNPGATPWTTPQKRHFHNSLDRQVWAGWSDRIRIRVSGAGDLARRFSASGLRLTFDVQWVLGHPSHWSVRVRKLPAGSTPTTFISNVSFATRQIELDSADLAAYVASNAAGASRSFRAGPHEFGHTFNNRDEYNAGSTLSDTNSIMNIGNQLRPRHLTLVLATLNRLVAGCVFRA